MNIEVLRKDMVAAMKAKDKATKDAISSLIAAVKKVAIDENELVDVVIRPEDIKFDKENGRIKGTVQSVVFKGVHYEMMIDTGETVFKVHSTIMQPQGSRVGLTIVPYNIHIMHPMPEPPVDKEAVADV